MVNPYVVLGISVSDDERKAKKRYRELCKIYHPDNPKTGNKEKFEEIQDAWKLLCTKGTQTVVVRRAKWHHKSLFKVVKEG